MVCPPWRCSDAPQRALTPAHECDSERGTDAAKKKKKRGGGRGAMQRAGALLRMRRRLTLPAAPPPIPLACCTARLRSVPHDN